MGLLDNFKAFVHSITTEDHYASYGSPYANHSLNGSTNVVGGNAGAADSSSRLHELNRLATANSSSHSLIESQQNNNSSTQLNNAGGPVGYRPGLRSSNTNLRLNSRNSSDVQLQNFSNGKPPLPSIESLWSRIENWLEEEYPELEDNLNYGVTSADLNEFENDLALGSLPVEFRQFYKIHDGQFRGGKPTGLVMGLTLLDIESIVEEYAIWAKVSQRIEKQQYMLQHQRQQSQQQQDSEKSETSSLKEASSTTSSGSQHNNFITNQKSIPPNAIQPYYVHRGWIPLIKDSCGNQFALDLAPGPAGQWGQIILFGREYDTKLVVASSFQEFMYGFVTDLEAGNFQIDQSESKVDNGYLDSSRDDDYMIGDEDEGEGELQFLDRTGKEFGAKLRGRLTYLEVWKRRALKNYGITNVESFQTTFTPQRAPPQFKRPTNPNATGSSSALNRPTSPSSPLGISGATSSHNASSNANNKSNPLINLNSTSKVALPKETLIGEDQQDKQEQQTPADTSSAAKKTENTSSKEIDEDKDGKSAESKPEEPEAKKEESVEKKDETEEKKDDDVKSESKDEAQKEDKKVDESKEDDKEVEKATSGLNDVAL